MEPTHEDLLDSLNKTNLHIEAIHKDSKELHACMDQRLDRLEKFQWTITGGLVVLLVIVVPIFINLINKG